MKMQGFLKANQGALNKRKAMYVGWTKNESNNIYTHY
jgi:hypothetical protein